MANNVPDWQAHVGQLEEFSRVRLIVADLDGTFVRSAAQSVYPSIRHLNRSLHRHGFRVALTVATGRAWTGAKALVEALSIPKSMPLILYNGALVVEHGTNGVVLHETIPFGAVQQIADLCGSWDVRVFAYCFDDPIAANLAGRAIEQVFGYGPNLPAQEFNGIPVNSWEEFPASSTLCTALLVDVSRLADSTFLRARLGQVHDTTCTSSGSRFVEIRPVGVNKGKALRAVATHLGIDLQEILAVGDNDNDVEMLETAGIGVSVCGASAAALAASHYVCRHGTAEGAVEIMRLVKHAKRFFVRPSLKREPR